MEQAVRSFVLTLEQESAWTEFIQGLPLACQDVFLLPGYARVFGKVYGAGIFCLTASEGVACSVYLMRPVHTLPFYAEDPVTAPLFDIITPEYSGPVIAAQSPQYLNVAEAFVKYFDDYCVQQRFVSEFGRMHPYFIHDERVRALLHAQKNRQVITVDITLSADDLWKGFSKGNKSSIKKARREGISVRRMTAAEGIPLFYRLYKKTMDRAQAKAFYYFSEGFFQELFAFLPGQASLFGAYYQGEVIAASVFLHHGIYMHYYFSGSDERFLHLCPNNLMVYEALLWGKAQGYQTVNLGGGYHCNGDDSLFAFKASFSSQRRDFYVYQKIFSQEQYDYLCALYRRDKESRHEPVEEGNGFFPLYRR